ncbi:MAG: beta strand repeat-containing protein, partial [Candidatus Eiseniibacteriota bacterium]
GSLFRDLKVGASGGTGTLNVQNGAAANVTGGLLMGTYSADTGTVVVGGVPGIDSARVTVAGDMLLGYAITGATQPGGGATFEVDSNGVAFVNQTTRLGSAGGSDAVLRVKDGGRFMTRSLYWEKAGGDLDLKGGMTQVFLGSFTTSDNHFKLNSLVAKPTFELESGASAALSGTGPSDIALLVGAKGSGRLRLTGGSDVSVTSAQSMLGQDTGSLGEFILRDASTFSSATADLVVGASGRGELHVLGGSVADVNALDIANGAGTGIVEVRGAGSQVHVHASDFTLPVAALGGSADVTVANGGLLSVVSVGPSTTIGSGAVVHVDTSSTFDALHQLTVSGTGVLDMEGGVASAHTIRLDTGGSIQGHGTVDARVLPDGSDTTGVIQALGPLTIGRVVTGLSGFDFAGQLDVGADTVTILSADGANALGRVSMSGGRLVLSAGCNIEAGRNLSGSGTVDGGIQNYGLLHAVGTSGLSFTGFVGGVGTAMNGSLFHFLPGSTFSGAGVVNARVQFDALSTLVASGSDLTVGQGSGAASILNGKIITNSNLLTIVSPSIVTLGGEVHLGLGTLAYSGAPTTFGSTSNASLTGRGTVQGNLTMNGLIAPGGLAFYYDSTLGNVLVTGNLTLGSSATCQCDLGDVKAGGCDSITTNSALVLAGTLQIRTLASFAASPGDSVRIATGLARTGTFSNVTLDGGSAAGRVEVHYTSTSAWLYFLPGVLAVGEDPTHSPAIGPPLRFAAVETPGPRAAIELALPGSAEVDVRLFDVSGRQVGRLAQGVLGAGLHHLSLPEGGLPAGVLFARAIIHADGTTQVRTTRLVLMR